MAFAAFATSEAQQEAPKKKSRVAFFLLLPGILYLILFFLTPLISLILTSLQQPAEFGDVGEYEYAFNWQNYVVVIQDYCRTSCARSGTPSWRRCSRCCSATRSRTSSA